MVFNIAPPPLGCSPKYLLLDAQISNLDNEEKQPSGASPSGSPPGITTGAIKSLGHLSSFASCPFGEWVVNDLQLGFSAHKWHWYTVTKDVSLALLIVFLS